MPITQYLRNFHDKSQHFLLKARFGKILHMLYVLHNLEHHARVYIFFLMYLSPYHLPRIYLDTHYTLLVFSYFGRNQENHL